MTVLVERPYTWKGRQPNLEPGRKLGSLTAVRQVGFLGNMSAWEFRCDCGKTVVRRGSHVLHAMNHPDTRAQRLHCGCKSRPRHHLTGTACLSYWKKKRPRLCPAWHEDVLLFKKECWDLRTGRYLLPLDKDQPCGPGNFLWSAISEKHYDAMAKAVDHLIQSGETEANAERRVFKMSRQRMNQIVHKATGLCSYCQEPIEAGYSSFCRKHRLSMNENERKYRART